MCDCVSMCECVCVCNMQDDKWGVSSFGLSNSILHKLHAYKCPQGYCRCTKETISNSKRCSSLYQARNSSAQCACHRTGACYIASYWYNYIYSLTYTYMLEHLLKHICICTSSAQQAPSTSPAVFFLSLSVCLSVQVTCVVPAPMELV